MIFKYLETIAKYKEKLCTYHTREIIKIGHTYIMKMCICTHMVLIVYQSKKPVPHHPYTCL